MHIRVRHYVTIFKAAMMTKRMTKSVGKNAKNPFKLILTKDF